MTHNKLKAPSQTVNINSIYMYMYVYIQFCATSAGVCGELKDV